MAYNAQDYSSEDIFLLEEAYNLANKCTTVDNAFDVGAIIKTADGSIFSGYSRELWGREHAEEVAIFKAIRAWKSLVWAILYSSLEPCSERSSSKVSCSELVIRAQFAKVFSWQREGKKFVENCVWIENLRKANIIVVELVLKK